MTILQGRIDVHHHIIPPAFVQTMQRKGIDKVAGAPLPAWTVEKSLAMMDANGIQTAITSLSAPGVHFGDGVRQASELARRCNEFAAEMALQHPGRFGSFAVLPTTFQEAACAEVEYALDELHADGVVLLGSTNGVFLGDPALDELMTELDRRCATVFVHPNMHETSVQLGLSTPGFLVEFLCDTTRAAVNLILSGSLDRFPNIRWILSHAGGFLPFVAWRLAQGGVMDEQAILERVRRFHFDTALSPSRYSMAVLKELVEPSHILFGSDFPFAPAPISALQCRTLDRSTLWPEPVLYGINRSHALQLFPHYRLPAERPLALPLFAAESRPQRLRRALTRPVAALAERLRDR